MLKRYNVLGVIVYASFFLLLVPGILLIWARFTDDIISFPVIESDLAGWVFTISGLILMLWGMFALIYFGRGWPMNAFPPRRLVKEWPFRMSRNPVYCGFGLLMIGVFVLLRSPAGLWLVAPVTILAMIALVVGYEIIDLKKRFPGQSYKTIFDFPERSDMKPSNWQRLAALLWILPFLFIHNYVIGLLVGDVQPLIGETWSIGARDGYEVFQLCGLLFFMLVPLLISKRSILRDWMISSLLALILSGYIALVWPEVGAQYLPESQFAYYYLPVYLILISYYSLVRQYRKRNVFYGILSAILIIIQLNYSKSPILHIITSVVIFVISGYYFSFWQLLKFGSEAIANSWKEWTFGKVRVINHGFYVGFGAFIGILLAGILAGNDYAWTILLFAIVVIVFSALWAQIIEGSEKLKRPYGYYGALVGIIFAGGVVWATGKNVWLTIGVITVVMPWVQAIGRLRCLINGCCHGTRSDDPRIGIRYFHLRSRVCGLSDLKGEWLHPTPLYSIIWLTLLGFLLLELWSNGMQAPFIFGIYLILTGIERFVEEAYRGEVQTPMLLGLRLYQWTAILSIIIGIIMTIIRVAPTDLVHGIGWETFFAALLGGIFTTIAMGVDFPYSNARFSRLV